MVQEIVTEWTGLGHNPKLSIMYIDDAADVGLARDNIAGLWNALEGFLSTSIAWRVAQDGKIMDSATGELTGFWTDTTPFVGEGLNESDPLPDATQLLVQWVTTEVVNGRRVRGRTFIPGMTEQHSERGNPSDDLVAGAAAGAQAMVTALLGNFVVWHRPTNGVGGSTAVVNVATVWDEWAVQRNRRG
jgi:hypothetical protein